MGKIFASEYTYKKSKFFTKKFYNSKWYKMFHYRVKTVYQKQAFQ